MNPPRLTLDRDYVRWRLEFKSFEQTCFGEVCEFVRGHLDDLLDDYYFEGHQSLEGFPGWAFERYLQGR